MSSDTVGLQPSPQSPLLSWWKDEETLLWVINEYIKLIYYAVAH